MHFIRINNNDDLQYVKSIASRCIYIIVEYYTGRGGMAGVSVLIEHTQILCTILL